MLADVDGLCHIFIADRLFRVSLAPRILCIHVYHWQVSGVCDRGEVVLVNPVLPTAVNGSFAPHPR